MENQNKTKKLPAHSVGTFSFFLVQGKRFLVKTRLCLQFHFVCLFSERQSCGSDCSGPGNFPCPVLLHFSLLHRSCCHLLRTSHLPPRSVCQTQVSCCCWDCIHHLPADQHHVGRLWRRIDHRTNSRPVDPAE